MDTTWDGLPVARERPFAIAIVVWRRGGTGTEFLLLHRLAPGGPRYEGDWAWTPPAGARQPGEAPALAASRELAEESGLALPLTPLPEAPVSDDVAIYATEAPSDAEIILDDEHDEFLWLSLAEAVPKCLPSSVGMGLANVGAWIAGASNEQQARGWTFRRSR